MYCRTDRTTGATWLSCYTKYEQVGCEQPSIKMGPLEEQVERLIAACAPAGELLERAAESLRQDRRDTRNERAALTQRKRRLLDLYEWGQIAKEEYAAKARTIEQELEALQPQEAPKELRELRAFLNDLPALYRAAGPEQRNQLLRRMFVEFLVRDYNIVSLKLTPAIDGALRMRRGGVVVDLPNDLAIRRR
jgi:thiamine pyrophosphate-dependent acetolactate synthase large subunit-like protein